MPRVEQNESVNSWSKFKEDGTIALVLRIVAGMCDGQYKELQVYLRLSTFLNNLFVKSQSVISMRTRRQYELR